MLLITDLEKKPKKNKNKPNKPRDKNIDMNDNIDLNDEKIKEKMKKYEDETGKYAIWRGIVTEGFKKYLKGEKIYDRDKERISLYVSEETKEEWQEFIKNHNYSTISKLIRESVDFFIEKRSDVTSENLLKADMDTLSSISHSLKEPLTSIKGFSQLLLETYNNELNEEILSTIKNIFDQSILLENKIINILDDIEIETTQYDILLIEDDLATIRLITTYFKSKGYICKGFISGSKGIEAIKSSIPKLILLDILLPDMSGYDLCKQIKSNEEYKNIPVFYLTAIPGSEVRKKIKETGADGFILKPFDFLDFEILFNFL